MLFLNTNHSLHSQMTLANNIEDHEIGGATFLFQKSKHCKDCILNESYYKSTFWVKLSLICWTGYSNLLSGTSTEGKDTSCPNQLLCHLKVLVEPQFQVQIQVYKSICQSLTARTFLALWHAEGTYKAFSGSYINIVGTYLHWSYDDYKYSSKYVTHAHLHFSLLNLSIRYRNWIIFIFGLKRKIACTTPWMTSSNVSHLPAQSLYTISLWPVIHLSSLRSKSTLLCLLWEWSWDH